jgi:hypothetical protein
MVLYGFGKSATRNLIPSRDLILSRWAHFQGNTHIMQHTTSHSESLVIMEVEVLRSHKLVPLNMNYWRRQGHKVQKYRDKSRGSVI